MKQINNGDIIAVKNGVESELPVTLCAEVLAGSITLDLIRGSGFSNIEAFSYTSTTTEIINLTQGASYVANVTGANILHISTAGGLVNIIPSA